MSIEKKNVTGIQQNTNKQINIETEGRDAITLSIKNTDKIAGYKWQHQWFRVALENFCMRRV